MSLQTQDTTSATSTSVTHWDTAPVADEQVYRAGPLGDGVDHLRQ